MKERKRILITVKTYPHPSKSYLELVCTAGVLEDGSFIRLYPVDFRYQPYWNWYKKYQWVEVDVERRHKDPRHESFRPYLDTLTLRGSPLSTKHGWAERRRYVLAQPPRTMCDLRQDDTVSLGIVKPRSVADVIVKPSERDWAPGVEAEMKQLHLLGPRRKPLEKIPYTFSYRFHCAEEGCRGHTMSIHDWEIGRLYLSMRDKFRDEDTAVEKVRQKFFDQMCAEGIDTHFFVGTTLAHGTWIVLGVFWPKKQQPR